MAAVTPWWEAVELREEVTRAAGSVGDVQMSLFRAVHGTAGERPPYAKPDYFGEITHPAPNLIEFMARVAVRLGAGARAEAVPAQWRLDQAMGGGKSHGLVGLWHLAAHPSELRASDIGRQVFEQAESIAGSPLPADLDAPQTVVLSCDNMTAGKGDPDYDGPAESLHERFLWRLFGGDKALYMRYQPHHANKAKLAEALIAVDRPVLILIDEILDYVRQLSDSENADFAVRDMSFIRALLDAVDDDVPNCALVVVMIASEHDATDLDATGQSRRGEIEDLLIRNATTATVTSNTDFGDILRRRLFKRNAAAEVLVATTRKHLDAARGQWQEQVFNQLPRCRPTEFEAEVSRCYPFHPLLMNLAELEWSRITGFQRVRSTIRIFAATAYTLAQRGKAGEWAPLLIGPGDLPLSVSVVREAVIGSGLIADRRTEANYRSLVAADIVAEDDTSGAARRLDLDRDSTPWSDSNPRAAERSATALFLYSVVGGRAQGKRGATEVELKAASFVPSAEYAVVDAETVLAELADIDRGLATREVIPGGGGHPLRWYLTTRQTLNMHYRAMRMSTDSADRDEEFARVAERLANTGPFKAKKFVIAHAEDDDPTPTRDIIAAAGIDDARSTRLVVLDPRRFSFLNGIDADTRKALRAALGIGNERLPVQWAASVVFAVVNTQRRGQARAAVADYLAWKRVCDIEELAADEDVFAEAKEKRNAARQRMEATVKAAYQHIAYLDEADGGKEMREARFEQDNETALDGTVVWAKLVMEGRALGAEQFDATALVHNLRDDDYDRPLSEIRDLFWSTPRMPLLAGGESDLKEAIHLAVVEGRLRIVGADGVARTIDGSAANIGIGQSSLRLAPPAPLVTTGSEDSEDYAGRHESSTADAGSGDGEATGTSGGGQTATADAPGPREVQLSFAVNTSLSDRAKCDAVWKALNDLAVTIDEGGASHIQFTVKVVVQEDSASGLEAGASGAGAAPSRIDM